MTSVPNDDAPARQAEPEGDLLALWLLTTSLILVAEGALSRSVAATLDGVKVQAVALALTGTVCLLRRATNSLEIGVLGVTAYFALVLWLRTFWLIVPLAGAAIFFFASVDGRHAVRTLARADLWVASAVAAVLVLSVRHYADFLIIEKLRYGVAHQDTLFHASVASMIKTYGVVSTGLNGLVGLEYHVLAHRFIAALSILAGLKTLETYGIAPILVLGPLVVAGATWCAWRLAPDAPRATIVSAWTVVCGVLTLLVLLPLAGWAVWDSYFVSESYALSLPLLLLAIPLIASPDLSVRASVVAAALCLLAGLTKGSVGVLGLGLFWARAIVLGGRIDRPKALAVAFVATLIFFYAMAEAARVRMNDAFNPFYYAQLYSVFSSELREAVQSARAGRLSGAGITAKATLAVASFMLFQFLLAWAVIVRRWRVSGARSILRHADSLFTVVAVALATAALMFELIGVWYFLNPPTFVALPFLAAEAGRRLALARPVPRRIVAAVVLLGASFLAARGYADRTGIFLKTRESFSSAIGPPTRTVDALLALRTQEGEGSVVFALDESFPRFPTGVWHCAMIPFVYPAVTERAWTGVIDAAGPCPYEAYGYPPYFRGPHLLVPAVIPPNAVLVPAGRLTTRDAHASDGHR